MKWMLCFIVATIVFMGQRESMAIMPDQVSIDGQAVVMPVGEILLISRGNYLGAVKFIQNENRKDGMYSRYEYFEHENGAFRKIREGVISRKIAPKEKWWYKLRTFFFHDIPSTFGDKLSLKSFELYAIAADEFHSTVCFWNAMAEPDVEVRLSPTPWRDIGEINLSDARIKWFGHDKGRERKVIAIDKIWD